MDIPRFTLSGPLSPEQARFLDEHGFIVFGSFLGGAEVDGLLAALGEVERGWIAEGRSKAHGIPIKYSRDDRGAPYVSRYAFASCYSEVLHAFVTSGRLEPVRALLGDQFRFGEREKDGMVVNHYLNLPGSKWKQLGWHTDGLRDFFYGKRQRPLWQVGLYLDDSPLSKGGLRVIPGTHRQGALAQLFGKRHFLDNEPDPREVCIEARRGDLTVHDGRLWHRVARATAVGEASRRRVIYLPFIDGPRAEKTEASPTPLYHYLQRLAG